MTNTTLSAPDRYAHLRAYAAQQKQATVERLRQAITQLEAEGRPVTTFTIREVSELDYMAYYRNPEALALFRKHSTHLRRERAAQQVRRRIEKSKHPMDDGDVGEGVAQPRDPLLNYKKPRLVAELHAALNARDQAQQHYHALLQEHMDCGVTIARLEAQVAEYLAFMKRFRTSLQEEENRPSD